jgi:bleomycin hydrolase
MSKKSSAAISSANLTSFAQAFNANPSYKLSRNALTRTSMLDVAMNWDAFSQINHTYSHKIKNEMKTVTDQKSSGRCWGFAGLNLMRIALCKKYDLEEFEFSQNYFMFCDKLEKANYFLENILATLDESYESRLMCWLLADPIQDGGQWDMFVNLIEKYGVVPKTAMPESYQSSKSHMMNRLITRKLRENAATLRQRHGAGDKLETLRQLKTQMMAVVYKMLCMCLGTPPISFEWQFCDAKKKTKRFTQLTPMSFYREHVDVELTDKVCLIHCPMSNKSMNEHYTVSYLGNVVGGQNISYANVEIEVMQAAAAKSIKADEAVWFGCDVGKMFHHDLGVMDMELYDYELLFNTEFTMDKQTKLEYGDSVMTHAMLLTGVDIQGKQTNKWRIENSWGKKGGDKGYLLMSDKWFAQYTYEIVVDKKYLPKAVLDIFAKDAVALNPWDPMGSLAR